jgi:hypothetical protein
MPSVVDVLVVDWCDGPQCLTCDLEVGPCTVPAHRRAGPCAITFEHGVIGGGVRPPVGR